MKDLFAVLPQHPWKRHQVHEFVDGYCGCPPVSITPHNMWKMTFIMTFSG
jgi:hypothetical protein